MNYFTSNYTRVILETNTATDFFKHGTECKTEWICPATAFFNVVLPLKFLGMTL